MRRTKTIGALAVASALLLAACGGGGTASAGDGPSSDTTIPASAEASTVSLVATEFSFDPSTVTVEAGSTVELVLENKGVVEHDFTIDEASVHIHANATETSSGTFSLPAGTYTFYCSVPGHREAGMEGTLVAE